jgi:hypothetical protein
MDGDAAAGGLDLDRLDLVPVAVGECGPGAAVAGVAALCLAEGGGDDGGYVVGDRGGQPLPGDRRAGSACLIFAGQGDDITGARGAGLQS